MKLKKLVVLFLCVLISGTFTACSSYRLVKADIVISDSDEITLVQINEAENTGGLFKLCNDSSEDIGYSDNSFSLHVYDSGEWKYFKARKKLFSPPAADDPGDYSILSSGNTAPFFANWGETLGQLTPGKYRLVKSVLLPGHEDNTRTVACEFEIK